MPAMVLSSLVFFFNDTAPTEIYTLSLHDALPIYFHDLHAAEVGHDVAVDLALVEVDRKSTRLNSSHSQISYAVFCLKKKNNRDAGLHGHPACRNRTHIAQRGPGL